MCKRNLCFKVAALLCAAAVLCFGLVYAEPQESPNGPVATADPMAVSTAEPIGSPDASVTPVPTDIPVCTTEPSVVPVCTAAPSAVPIDKTEQIKTLMTAIANSYADTTDPWAVFDMVCGGYKAKLKDSNSAKAAFVKAAAESENMSDLDKFGFALSALGENIATLTLSDGSKYNLLESISKYDETNIGYVTNAIMALALYNSADYNPDAGLTEEGLIDYILNSRSPSGLWGYSWEGVDYIDYDSTAMVLNAFAPYYTADSAEKAGITEEKFAEIKAVVDKAVDTLSNIQMPGGSLGSANTDAVAIIGLAAVGINPDTDLRFVSESGAGLTDGMLGYALGDNSGFGYIDNIEYNSMATEQCFRALIALQGLNTSQNGRYNIYDIEPISSETPVSTETPGTDRPHSGGSSNSGGSTGGSTAMSVTCTVTGDTAHGAGKHTGGYPTWISSVTKSLSSGSTAAQLIKAVLADAGYTAVGIDSGYISSITAPDGTKLAEGTNGVNSGWLYRVNGISPKVGISDYKLKSGDKVELYYTDDYTKDDNYNNADNTSGTGGNAGIDDSQATASPAASVSPSPNPGATEIPLIFVDVDEDYWGYEYINELAKTDVLTGDGDGKFRPDDSITRAEFTAVLARSAGEDGELTQTEFSDVPESEWYSGYVAWADEAGIVNGVGDNRFEPELHVTREDACVMITRAMNSDPVKNNESELSFSDKNDISEYAVDAVVILWSDGIINGYDDGSFRPKSSITRAEACKILTLYK